MVKEELDVQSVLKEAKAKYRELYNNGKWPTAIDTKDSKALNKNCGSVNATQESSGVAAIEKIVDQLTHKMDGNGQSKLTCYNCDKKGHMARDCCSKKNTNGGNNNQCGKGKGTPYPKKDKSCKQCGKGSEALKAGEPKIKCID